LTEQTDQEYRKNNKTAIAEISATTITSLNEIISLYYPFHILSPATQWARLMHNKFCVIDNQKVLTGSYNCSNNAETKNDENVTILNDPDQATKYTLEFKRLLR
jgi:phosphatidylserine/phosphatidylglycerophosphate/cardiolipin synthase-like enzyme